MWPYNYGHTIEHIFKTIWASDFKFGKRLWLTIATTVGFCILVYCEAVRSAILATAWLLVSVSNEQQPYCSSEAAEVSVWVTHSQYQILQTYAVRSWARATGGRRPTGLAFGHDDTPGRSHKPSCLLVAAAAGRAGSAADAEETLVASHYGRRPVGRSLLLALGDNLLVSDDAARYLRCFAAAAAAAVAVVDDCLHRSTCILRAHAIPPNMALPESH